MASKRPADSTSDFQVSAKQKKDGPQGDDPMEEDNGEDGAGAAGSEAPGSLELYNADANVVTIRKRWQIGIGSYRPGTTTRGNDISMLPDMFLQFFTHIVTPTAIAPLRKVRDFFLKTGQDQLTNGKLGFEPIRGRVKLHSFIPLSVGIVASGTEQTSFNEAPFAYIGTGPLPNAINIAKVPVAKRTLRAFLQDGVIRTESDAWGGSSDDRGPLKLQHVQTIGKGQSWSKGYSFKNYGKAYQLLSEDTTTETPIYMPFDSTGGEVVSNTSAGGRAMVANHVTHRPTFIWMPYIQDIAEGANPIQLRGSLTMESELTMRLWSAPDQAFELAGDQVQASSNVITWNEQLLKLSTAANTAGVLDEAIRLGKYMAAPKYPRV